MLVKPCLDDSGGVACCIPGGNMLTMFPPGTWSTCIGVPDLQWWMSNCIAWKCPPEASADATNARRILPRSPPACVLPWTQATTRTDVRCHPPASVLPRIAVGCLFFQVLHLICQLLSTQWSWKCYSSEKPTCFQLARVRCQYCWCLQWLAVSMNAVSRCLL